MAVSIGELWGVSIVAGSALMEADQGHGNKYLGSYLNMQPAQVLLLASGQELNPLFRLDVSDGTATGVKQHRPHFPSASRKGTRPLRGFHGRQPTLLPSYLIDNSPTSSPRHLLLHVSRGGMRG